MISRISTNIFLKSPWFGVGSGRFQAMYGNFQAAYLATSDEYHRQLAGNVRVPLNEFILLGTELGLIGLILLGIFAYLKFFSSYNPINSSPRIIMHIAGKGACLSAGIFSFFSYSFQFLQVELLILVSLSLIEDNRIGALSGNVKYTEKVLQPFLCLMMFLTFLINTKKGFRYYQWRNAFLAYNALPKKSLEIYRKIYPSLKYDQYFLYNYGMLLYGQKNFIESLDVLLLAQTEIANSDILVAIAENYNQLHQPDLAERYLKLSIDMVPNRIVPIYKLMLLYASHGKRKQAMATASIIIKFVAKVPSRQVDDIKLEALKYAGGQTPFK